MHLENVHLVSFQDIYLPCCTMKTKKWTIFSQINPAQYEIRLQFKLNKFLRDFRIFDGNGSSYLALSKEWIVAIKKYFLVNSQDIYLPANAMRTKK